MKKRLALVLASAMFLLSACGGGSTSTATTEAPGKSQAPQETTAPAAGTKETAAPAAGEVIRIGCPQPLTGTNALVGDTTVKAAQLAVKQINASGGLLGRQVELVVYDDQASPEEAVKIATKLIEVDKVDMVCGSLISSCVLASGQFFEEAKIPCIGTGLSSTWMQQGWDYVFRACPNAGMGMPALAGYMKNLGITKIAIFQGQDDSSASGAEDMRNACREGIRTIPGRLPRFSTQSPRPCLPPPFPPPRRLLQSSSGSSAMKVWCSTRRPCPWIISRWQERQETATASCSPM